MAKAVKVIIRSLLALLLLPILCFLLFIMAMQNPAFNSWVQQFGGLNQQIVKAAVENEFHVAVLDVSFRISPRNEKQLKLTIRTTGPHTQETDKKLVDDLGNWMLQNADKTDQAAHYADQMEITFADRKPDEANFYEYDWRSAPSSKFLDLR